MISLPEMVAIVTLGYALVAAAIVIFAKYPMLWRVVVFSAFAALIANMLFWIAIWLRSFAA